MKLTLLLLVVTGCLAKPHLSQRERNFWEKLNRLQDYKPDESKRDFYDDNESKRDFYDDNESKRDFYDDDESRRDFYDVDESKRDFYDDDESKRSAITAPATTKKTPATIVLPTTKKTPATIRPATTKKTPVTIRPATTKKAPASEIEELGVAFNKSRWKSRNEAIWVFTDNWSEAVFGDLVAGYSVLIVYDGARLPWRDMKYGQRAWNIFAQFKFDDGKVHQQLLQGPIMIEGHEILTTQIFLPFGTSKLTIWFKFSGATSGIHWDSDYGKNYEEQVHEVKEPTLVFHADYTEDQYGRPLEQGKRFQVYYSTGRLDVSGGFRLYAVAQFKASGSSITHELTNPHNSYYVTSFYVSEDAEEVIMWFYAKRGDEKHYDSNFGANYHFPLGY